MAAKYTGCFKPVSQDTGFTTKPKLSSAAKVSPLSNEEREAPGACPQACAAVSVPSCCPALWMSTRSQCMLFLCLDELSLRRQRILHETLPSQSPAKRMVTNSKDRPFSSLPQIDFFKANFPIAKNLLRVGQLEAFFPQPPLKNNFLSFPKLVKLKLCRLFIIYKGMGLCFCHEKSLFFTLINMYFQTAWKETPGVKCVPIWKAVRRAVSCSPCAGPPRRRELGDNPIRWRQPCICWHLRSLLSFVLKVAMLPRLLFRPGRIHFCLKSPACV